MEEKNYHQFFRQKEFAKNLFLAEEKDYLHLVGLIKKNIRGDFFSFSQDHSYCDLMNEIMQPSLFAERKVFAILYSEDYSDQQWDILFSTEDVIFFFLRKAVKKSLLQRFQSSGAILNLLQEKPWDRKNRLVSEVVYAIHKDGMIISQSTAYRFVERVSNDLLIFNGELEKLRAYARGKEKIDDKDIDQITQPLLEENTFKISEEIVWKQNTSTEFQVDSITILLQMIGTLRFQAYLGLKILSKETIQLPPWQEKKYRDKASILGIDFFKKVLRLLFKAEKRAKSTTIAPKMLFDLTFLEIIALKKV